MCHFSENFTGHAIIRLTYEFLLVKNGLAKKIGQSYNGNSHSSLRQTLIPKLLFIMGIRRRPLRNNSRLQYSYVKWSVTYFPSRPWKRWLNGLLQVYLEIWFYWWKKWFVFELYYIYISLKIYCVKIFSFMWRKSEFLLNQKSESESKHKY